MTPPMACTRLGTRWLVASFHGLACDGIDFSPTNVAFIESATRIHACDTYLGPGSMNAAWEEASRQGMDINKPVVVFNTHADWDHHWGNCFFRGATIIAHRLTAAAIESRGKIELEQHGHLATGQVILVPPTTTFTSTFSLDEGITFFHAPGHTPDSCACHDEVDGVLFTGDDVEDPVPWLSTPDLGTYIDTLEGFLAMEPRHVVPGHGPAPAGPDLVQGNLTYLRALDRGHDAWDLARGARAIHEHNLDVITPR